MVWEPLPTVIVCCTSVAAKKSALPAWSASMTHSPTPMKRTSEPDTAHVELAWKVTALPEAPPLAVTV